MSDNDYPDKMNHPGNVHPHPPTRSSGKGRISHAGKRPLDVPLQKYVEIPFSRIVPVPSLEWLGETRDEPEQETLLKFGELTPLVVQSQPEQRFRLVDGYQRRRAMQVQQKTKQAAVVCHVLPENLPWREVLLFRLQLQPASKRMELSGNQACRLVRKMHQAGLNVKELSQEVLPCLGEKASARLANRMLQLAKLLEPHPLPESLQRMSVADLLLLLKFPGHLLPEVVELCRKMTLGSNKWKTLLQLLDEVSKFREADVRTILGSPEIRALLDHQELQGPVLYRKLKQQLEHWRYPELWGQRSRYAEILAQLQLPPGIEIEADPYFESDELTLRIQAGSCKELKRRINELELNRKDAVWRGIFQIAREG